MLQERRGVHCSGSVFVWMCSSRRLFVFCGPLSPPSASTVICRRGLHEDAQKNYFGPWARVGGKLGIYVLAKPAVS